MASIDNIEIDFQHIATGDPKRLVIMDTSVWSFIENKTAIIEILVPGSSKPVTYNIVKNKTNIFNSSNLYLGAVGTSSDLPDGVYKVTVKGSPDKFCKMRYILKDDRTRLELYKLYSSTGLEGEDKDPDIMSIIKENKLLIDGANAEIVLGNHSTAGRYLQIAYENLTRYTNCKDCTNGYTKY